MEVTETSSDGLKREFRIVVPASELSDKVARRLDELGHQVRLPGFRPGKVPPKILRQRFGSHVLSEVLQNTVENSSAEAMREHNLRPALPPKVDVVSFQEGTDLEYKMSVELLPEIPEANFAGLGIERLAVEVPEEAVDRAVERLAEQQRKTEPVDRPAATGDIVVADFEGRIEGQVFPGGSGTDRQVELGSGAFIPGFEEQLVGVSAGEKRSVRVTFPAEYGAAEVAGKEAEFDVTVKEVREKQPAAIDDALAEAVGLENLAELRQEIRQSLERNYEEAARLRLKRGLLDRLAERYDFPVPPGMVDLEFDEIWAQRQAAKAEEAGEGGAVEATAGEAAAAAPNLAGESAEEAGVAPPQNAVGEPAGTSGTTPQAGAPDEEADKAEFRGIAERRVRLGLLLAEIASKNNITVSQEEVNQALLREARRHPGHERQVIDYYRQNPGALGSLRAPILEDKVVDFILEMAKPETRKVTPEELMAMPQPGDEPVG